MKYAYPQDPTHAVSAIRRYDESSDSSTSQSSLERQQDIAVVGETVPMIFCHRFNWGGSLGVNGGVWMSPRLIQLGIEQAELSMMYLLSQGKVTGLQTANTYWGYQKLTEVDSGAQMCYAYESVPSCLDLDYDPGGSLSWTTTQTSGGPSLSSSSGSFNSPSKTIKMVVTFNANIQVSGSAQIVGGFGGYVTLAPDRFYANGRLRDKSTRAPGRSDDPVRFSWPDASQPSNSFIIGYWESCLDGVWPYYHQQWTSGGSFNPSTTRSFEYNRLHKSASWNQTSEVRYNWRVVNTATNQTIKSGSVWIRHGTSSLTIDGLPAGQYQLVFDGLYKERNAAVSMWSLSSPSNPEQFRNDYNGARSAGGPGNGFRRYTSVGSETQIITTSITSTIYNQIDFPDLPGGDQQIVGGLSDLTMMGIAGDVLKLRPNEGPDYFIQSHIFVEQGIEVERLTWGGTGSSPFYGDLVNYLMNSTQVLKPDQIDRDSLILANRLNERYDMYFNGVLQTTNSLAEWMTRTAPYFLLTPRQVDGKYGLWPVCPINSANELSRGRTVPVLTVTRDDIVQGSYGRSYISVKDRRPVCLVMVYRDQPSDNVGQTVTVEVRYPGTALSGPFESHDLTEFCCRAEQAVYAARYILAKRRYTTHTVSFTMARRAAQLKPGDIIKVDLALDTTDGAGITDAIFYQIESLAEGQGGSVAIEATHFPTFGNDVSLVAYETHQGNVSIQ
nr:unnamed protein product [uncultured Mediterranean phage uvMED]